jgi:lysyl-tRNA synthetase class 2
MDRSFSYRFQAFLFCLELNLQAYKFIQLSKSDTEDFEFIKSCLDMGDFVSGTGTLFETKRGEKSILVSQLHIASKSIRPIPSEWYGISDSELKLRKRYLDFMMSKETREIFEKKSIFWETIRAELKEHKFLEVDTPILEAIPGGAEAEPFVTHHNALDRDFYLRISLELHLKRLLVGGFDRVFEIGRVFRNEGIDREHLQDYTQMECYASYTDYEFMMKFMENLYKKIVKNITGGYTTTYGDQELDWDGTWERVDYYDAFQKETGFDIDKVSESDLHEFAKKLNIKTEKNQGKGRLIDLIYKHTVRPKLIQPCFLINPPVLIEPLAKRSAEFPNRVERFQIVAGGTELGKGFSELNDPIDQRERFESQMKLREKGDAEAQMLDEDFLEALEYGMPPASGFGLSERLFAVLMNRPIRETSTFPLMREK